MNKKAKERIFELDALRGIASLLVVIFHLLMNSNGLTFNIGSTGVDLFFMISGFVIYNSIDNESKPIAFIKSRFIRLFPIYWVVVIFTFILIRIAFYLDFPNIELTSIKDFFINLTMIQYYFKVKDIDGPFWTLILELNFYVLVLFLFRFRVKIPILFFIFTVIVFVCELFISPDNKYYQSILFNFPLFKWIPLFSAGILFYKIYKKEIQLAIGLTMLLICYGIQIFIFYQFHSLSDETFISFNQHLLSTSIYFLLFSLLVTNKLKFISNKATLFLGRISYPLYLIHQFISISIIIPFCNQYLGINYYISSFLICLPLILILSFLFHKYIELKLSKVLLVLLKK